MYSYLVLIMLLCIGTAISLISIPLVYQMLVRSGLVRENYRGEKIPVSMGISFIPTLIINSMILIYCNVDLSKKLNIFIFLFATIAMSFAGVIDDILGNRSVTGLIGHFKSFLRGRLTTGGYKAILGGFIGLCVSVALSKSILEIIVGTLVVALSTNFMNLFDLRPGRALKVFFFITVIIFLMASIDQKEIIAIILPVAWSYFYYDISAKSMMGDSGSNVLGMAIGIFFIEFYDIRVQAIWLLFLIITHILTEKYSITDIIEKNKVLKYIDNFGRK